MGIDKHDFLIDGNRTIVDFSDTDSSNIFIVVDRADQYLCICIRVAFRCRNVIDDRLKERDHVFRIVCQIKDCMTSLGRCIDKWTVQLLVRCVKIHEKF